MALNVKNLFPLDHPTYAKGPAPSMGLRAECEAFNTQKDEREKRPSFDYYRALDHMMCDRTLHPKDKINKERGKKALLKLSVL